MKKYLLVTSALAATALLFFIFLPPASSPQNTAPSTQAPPSPQEKLESKHGPAEHFSIQRAYPDPAVDIRAYEAALSSARLASSAKTSSTGITNTPWRLEGPTNIGGRINTVAIDPNNPSTILTGSANSGIYKTTNGGATWNPIFDDASNLSMGHITFQPGSSQVIWAGTGDPNISGYPSIGDGIYKSTDAGATWTNMGLADQRIVSKIVVDPNNPDKVYVGCMGLPMERNNDRGLYITTNGGATWTQSLFVSNQAGIIDLVMDPNNSQVLYASSWDRIRTNQESTVSGPDAKVWKTTDGGANWVNLTSGLPNIPLSRVNLANHPTNSNILYACFVNTDYNVYNIYKTTNAGSSWNPIDISSLDPFALGGFGWYFGNIMLDPTQPSHLYLLGVQLWRTTNDGITWEMVDPDWWTYDVHADKHAITFNSSGDLFLGTDGGLYKTTTGGLSWSDIDEIPNSEFYRVAVNPHTAGEYYGGMQDNGTSGGNYLSTSTWPRIFGGDGFQVLFTTDPSELIVETQNGGLAYLDNFGSNSFSNGIDGTDRTNWDQPIMQSPTTPYTFYTGTYRVYKSTGPLISHNWTAISGDLTDGVIFGDRFHNISAVEESPLNAQLLYAGTSDGNVHRSTNGGGSWTNISNGVPKRYVTSVKASPHDANEVFVTVSGYKYNDYIPHVLRSTNRGDTWTDIAGDLPQLALNDILVHPTIDSIYVVASDGGVYATTNWGQNWHRIGNNMPFIPVYDMEWDTQQNRLVAGTHARSIQSFPMDSIKADVIINVTPPRDLAIKLYPSPASTSITLAGEIGQGAWEIHDLSGRMVKQGLTQTSSEERISVEDLPAGAYILKLRKEDASWSKRFLKE